MTAPRRVAIDCRWLGPGGAGTVTAALLAELTTHRPDWELLLWGDPRRIEPYSGLGQIVPVSGDPTRLMGQADALRVPRADVIVYLHQIRPWTGTPAVTFMHDTIPLRHGGTPLTRSMKRMFMQVAARRSERILTVSEYARQALVQDLGIPWRKIGVVELAVSDDRAAGLATRRRELRQLPQVLYIGRFAAHKNVRQLIEAFQHTESRQRGATLVLAGGSERDVARLEAQLGPTAASGVRVQGQCSDGELVDLMARSWVLATASLEEGFGLPAFEAAASGMPVVCTKTGHMATIPESIATFCDPRDAQSIARAIDAAMARPPILPPYRPSGNLGQAVVEAVEAAASTHPAT